MKKMPKHIKNTLEQIGKEKPHVCPTHEHSSAECNKCLDIYIDGFEKGVSKEKKTHKCPAPIVQWKEGPERVVYKKEEPGETIAMVASMLVLSVFMFWLGYTIHTPPVVSPAISGDNGFPLNDYIPPLRNYKWEHTRHDLENIMTSSSPVTGTISDGSDGLLVYISTSSKGDVDVLMPVDEFHELMAKYHALAEFKTKCQKAWTILNKDKDAGRKAFRILDE